jgi:glutamate racemase
MRNSRVGVFDSGVGGLSVLKHVRALLPRESLVYCADSGHAPYGSKTSDQIRARSQSIADFLLAQGVKAIVVACNTATAAAVDTLRRHYSIPVIGMEPAVKPAVSATRTGVIGVMATVGTLKSAQFAALLENYGQGVQVVTQACHGLVERVERGELDSSATRALVRSYVEPLIEKNADTLVLGCTHYPFLRGLIEQEVGPDVAIIDTGAAVARQLQRRLEALDLLATAWGSDQFWSSGDVALAETVMTRLWGCAVHVQPLQSETPTGVSLSL